MFSEVSVRGHLGLLQWVCSEAECHDSADESWTLRISLHSAQVGAVCVLPLPTAFVPSGLQNAGRYHTHIGGGDPCPDRSPTCQASLEMPYRHIPICTLLIY